MRRINFKLTAVIIFSSLIWLTAAEAAIIYVDKDNSCPGAGTTESPYCSIQNAFNKVIAGDTIRIRDAVTPYDQNAILTTSGMAGSPIIIESAWGHRPIIR